jgi:putative flippase GtrA
MMRQPIKNLAKILSERWARLLRYGCVGAFIFGLDFSLVFLIGKVLPPIATVSIAYFVAVSLHFCLNKWWVFGARNGCSLRELLSYAGTAALCWACTVLTVKAALASFTHNLLVAKMTAVIPTMLLGFFLMRLVVFRQARPESQTLS